MVVQVAARGGNPHPGKIDWPGNLVFAVGPTALLAGITCAVQLYGGSSTGFTNPWVLAGILGGVVLLVWFVFIGLLLIPVNFDYAEFAVLTGLSGIGSGLFSAPNRTAIMNSVPANQRGSASGMAGTLLNAGSSLSIGIFFSLMTSGLATDLPTALHTGLTANGVPQQAAAAVAQTPPAGSLFAPFLGYNPSQSLLAPTGSCRTCLPRTWRHSPASSSFPS